ncbi:type VII secretion protein EssC [Alkalicoccobacillus murimartini]|uniref:S-DNA-T family DNA segregation ATPase FtsK/SpoIIIE n=1 Tax=Alkalicoccobacillus murimartini TaxID=171685 RepID=A0ABT9YLI8_9BACI|nr:type VII secretion protein EssC [Alkalicoccobacillus murimartini]MDQ0208509.1 S-DNA-T family DNA segregation ATPase FtsK/SpoIIIE [Alkalicoccobacillus murimartini]
MSQLWMITPTMYQSVPLESSNGEPFWIGTEKSNALTTNFPLDDGELEIKVQPESNECRVYQKGRELTVLMPYKSYTLSQESGDVVLLITDESVQKDIFYVGAEKEISLSMDGQGTFYWEKPFALPFQSEGVSIIKRENKWILFPYEASFVFINGQRIFSRTEIHVGDLIFCPAITFCFVEEDLMQVVSYQQYTTHLKKSEVPASEMKRKYPEYRRTPRMLYDLPAEKVSFSFPSQEVDDNGRALWIIIAPPLVMLLVMGFVALVIPRGLYIIISLTMFMTTLITSTVTYFKEKKKRKIKEETRDRVYKRYLKEKREELQEYAEKQREVLDYHYPSYEQLKYLTKHLSGRIWEKSLESEDFLHFRIGHAVIPSSYTISTNSSDFSNRDIDELLERSRELTDAYENIPNAPIEINFAAGMIGLIGKQSIVRREIKQILGQLAFFHSYHDVRFVAVFPEDEYENWQWLKWLPHFQIPNTFAKGFIYNEQTRDQLLSIIYELLRERELREEKNVLFVPHIVFVVSNRALISEHPIMEYLESKVHSIGISVIFATEVQENLSEHIHTLIKYINETEGEITIEEGKAVHRPFDLDTYSEQGNEEFARLLYSLDHQVGMSHSIPDMVGFMELLKAETVEDLDIVGKWSTNQSSKSLAVPIGLKGPEDEVFLNLHEKAHGPHGLLAGTTGSGKSEFLQTFILSLSVYYHPHEVAFLLIDYKGGGMALPFKDMPHLLGTITNISESRNFSERALASIKAELKRRQSLFDTYEVNHINGYTDLYKANEASEPLPHLFIISDEFAELKNEEPEFIKELVSAARIGRSLGVHLILATQKPGGIIDDQIWSNSRFKVALKVSDATDSKEILKNSDAAGITVTGRGYLKVGNNEVYELFQSAWSGAPYLKQTYEGEEEISIVTDLGLVQVSDVKTHDDSSTKEVKTEIEAVVEEIIKVQNQLKIEKAASPWLPPLGEHLNIETPMLNSNEFIIGLRDEPEKQLQEPFTYEWVKDGNIGIFGAAGFGKSMTVLRLLLSFSEEYAPNEAQFYIFDFGNGSMLPLKNIPHTGDYFKYDEERKIEKFVDFLKKEMERRKNLFTEYEANTIEMFNNISEEKMPVIFIAFDNFDLVREEFADLESHFTQFARDGQALGIFTILTASRGTVVRQPLMNTLKVKIVHYLHDKNEAVGLVGRSKYEIEQIPGRALISKDKVYLTQMYLPVHGRDDLQIYENIRNKVEQLTSKYQGIPQPESIAMLPSKLTYQMFKQYPAEQKRNQFPVGLDEHTVKPVQVDLGQNHLLIFGQSKKGKSNVLKILLEGMLEAECSDITIFDGLDRSFSSYVKRDGVNYIDTKEDILEWCDVTESILQEREEQYIVDIREGKVNHEFETKYLLIDSMSRFMQSIDSKIQEKMASMMKKYSHLGFSLVVSGNFNEFSKGYDSLSSELKLIRQAIILMRKQDQSLMSLSYTRKEQEIQPGFGYIVINGQEMKVQIPKV